MFCFCITLLLAVSAVMRNMILTVSFHIKINTELIQFDNSISSQLEFNRAHNILSYLKLDKND